MLARFALLAVSFGVVATASANPLIGGLKSDRDLPLLEAEKLATLAFEQRAVLRTHDLFGRSVMIYGDRETELRLSEGSTRLWQRIVATGSDGTEIEYDDAPASLAP